MRKTGLAPEPRVPTSDSSSHAGNPRSAKVPGLISQAVGSEGQWRQLMAFLSVFARARICGLLSALWKNKRRFLWALSALFVCVAVVSGLIYYRDGLRWHFDELTPAVAILRPDGEVVT